MRPDLGCLMRPAVLWCCVLAAGVLLPYHARAQLVGAERVLVSVSNADETADTLHALDPEPGATPVKLFDFTGHPRDQTGRILGLRVSADGGMIYFSSDNNYVYGPARRNVFRIASDGGWVEQITPGPNSGLWGQAGPYGLVAAKVTRPDGSAWSSCPVFLEGVGMQYSEADGSAAFPQVPRGPRWIVAYRPGSTVHDAKTVNVEPGLSVQVFLTPNSDGRTNLEHPIPAGDRIYYLLWPNTIQWTDVEGIVANPVYTAGGTGVGITDVDGYDVGPRTARLAVMDYQTGCPTNRGLYLTDKDGGDVRLLVDLKQDFNWSGGGEVFWSPDETRLAFKAQYGPYVYFVVADATSGAILGSVGFADQSYTIHNARLHGWSPDGGRLLFSHWAPSQPANHMLAKVRVGANGAIDGNSTVQLLSGAVVSSATWARLGQAASAVKGR